MALEMYKQAELNFDILKDDISRNMGKYISHCTLNIKQLDKEHLQLENGVPPCQFSCAVLGHNDIWNFIPQNYEFDDSLHTFRVRDDITIVGDLLIVLLNGTTMTGFCIKPTVIDGKQYANLILSPIYSTDMNQESMAIKLEFDKNKRIQRVHFPTIDISQHSHLRNMILKEVLYSYKNAHIKNTLELMNKLSYELIMQKHSKAL